jgi:endonuclease/exonuclease/phosphatase family metal-dependent hydrolase
MKLISWNIQRGRGLHQSCSIARVVADLRHMAEFDVLCLQEVASGYTDLPGADGGNQFMQLARLLPGYTPLAGVATDTMGQGDGRLLFGNMIFSRYPVLQVLRHALPWPADPAVMSMQRSAIEATLQTPQGLLRVCTAHLEYFSLLQRASQVERLRELHRDACLHAGAARPGDSDNGPFCAVPRAMPGLLMGDFNFLPDSAEYRRLLTPFEDGVPALRDAWRVRHPGVPNAPSVCLYQDDTVPFTFDYIFASADLAPRVRELRVMPGNFGPDHQPLLIELD